VAHIVESLPSKREALSSNSSTTKKKKNLELSKIKSFIASSNTIKKVKPGASGSSL
jgi:hypothetical protein